MNQHQLDSETSESQQRLLQDRFKLHQKYPTIYMPALVDPSQIKPVNLLSTVSSLERSISSQNQYIVIHCLRYLLSQRHDR